MFYLIEEIVGEDLAGQIMAALGGELMRIPKLRSKAQLIPIIKKELTAGSTYREAARKYKLSERTIRRYEQWTVKDGSIVSPDGRMYSLED